MEYILTLALLALLEWGYLPVARRFEIGNKVTFRSSHKEFVITGGGFVFYLAALSFYLFNLPLSCALFTPMLVGGAVLALVSYVDDVDDVNPAWRLLIQFAVVAYAFSNFIQPATLHFFLIILICGVGLINAYNFMDGINGMLAGYSLVVLGTFAWAYAGLPPQTGDLPLKLIAMLSLAVAVFAFFNMRSKALCFSGDVGSIVMGFFVTWLLVWLILYTLNSSWVVIVAVYAVDAGLTVIQRLFIGENILTPHRRHVYQILVNQWGIPHWRIALCYAGLQAVINFFYLMVPRELQWLYVIIVVLCLTAMYFIIKHDKRSRSN